MKLLRLRIYRVCAPAASGSNEAVIMGSDT
jgi:hypothetical protein